MSIDIDTLTDEELTALAAEIRKEQAKRADVRNAEQQIESVREKYGTAREPGSEWVQPTSVIDAYITGETVTHNGKSWVSLVTPNTWEPGKSGWREDAGEDEDGNPVVPEFVQPTGSHDAYQLGDRVTFEGAVYESIHDGANTWSPAAYPPAWKKVEE